MLQLMQDVNTMSLDRFQADILARKHNMRDLMPSWEEWEWDGRHSYCLRVTPGLPGIANFVKDIRKLSIGLVLALYVTFGHKELCEGTCESLHRSVGGPETG